MSLVNFKDVVRASSRIEGLVHRTPVVRCPKSIEPAGYEVYLKCENLQLGGAFKARGATNALLNLSADQRKAGVVAHSSGNHAQALSLAAQKLKIPATIVMPDCSPLVKLNATRDTYGATVVKCRNSQAAREETTQGLIESHGYVLVHPYDNDFVIAGAGTACLELLDEVRGIETVFAPCGGGGLLSGTSIVCHERGVRAVGCEPELADDAHRSFTSGTLVPNHNVSTIADGLRTSLSERTFRHISKYCSEIKTVSESDIVAAMRLLFERAKLVVEPSGAVSFAVCLNELRSRAPPDSSQPTKVGVIISGGNVDLDPLFEYYQKLE